MTAETAAAKNAALVMTSDMGSFLAAKIQKIRGGKPVTVCPQTAGVTDVPVAAPCRSNTHLGGAFIAYPIFIRRWRANASASNALLIL